MALTQVKGSILSDELYKRENNLNDVLDKNIARNNLNLYSKNEINNIYENILPDKNNNSDKFLFNKNNKLSWENVIEGLPTGFIFPYCVNTKSNNFIFLESGKFITETDYPKLYSSLLSIKKPKITTYEINFVSINNGKTAEITTNEMDGRPLIDYVNKYFIYPNWIAKVKNYRLNNNVEYATLFSIVGDINNDSMPDVYESLIDIAPINVLDAPNNSVFLPDSKDIKDILNCPWAIKL